MKWSVWAYRAKARWKRRHAVKIVQVFRATREIVAWLEADTLENALDLVASGGVDPPPFDHPDWSTSWDLQNEEVERA